MEWLKTNQIKVDPPKKPKKITGTRFASILGKNIWNTPFQTWCEITKTCVMPFEDTKYTLAGKAIEPKQAEYMKKKYFMTDIVTPVDRYGKDYFKKTYGDFFPDNEIFGGMWDFLNYEDGELACVLEMKTTGRPQDWEHDIPEYYALQGALYAYLLGCEDVVMVATFLDEKDYDHPEKFVVTGDNTKVIEFKLHRRYPDFEKLVAAAAEWWATYVVSGISPKYDEKKDAEYLKKLRTDTVAPDEGFDQLLMEADTLMQAVADNDKAMKPVTDRLKIVKEAIKDHCMAQFKDGIDKVEVTTSITKWTLSKGSKTEINSEALEADGLLAKYQVTKDTYTLRNSKVK